MEDHAKKTPNKKALFFQIYVGMCAGMGAMTSGAWLAWPSAAIAPLLKGENCCTVERHEINWMVALLDLGNVLTPIPASYFMDWFGRKPTLYSTAFLNITGSILIWVANNVWYLYIARLFVGMAKGIAFAVVPIFIAEVANVQIRGALSTMFIGFLNTGAIYEYVIAAVTEENRYPTLNYANLVTPIIFTISFFFVRESPYYLTMKEKEEKAIRSLAQYRQLKKEDEALKAESALIAQTVKEDLAKKGRFIDLFTTKPMRRATLIVALLALFQRSSGISPTLAFMTITLPEHGGGLTREVYMIVFSVILVAANYAVSPLVDTWGRKNLLIVSALTTAIVHIITAIYYFCQNNDHDVSSWKWLPYACLVAFACTYSFGIGFIPSTLVGELFPTNIKCYASSVSAIILAATSFVMNRIFREVADSWGVEYMYLIFALTQIFCLIFVIFWVFETMGKTFVEIQNILKDV